MSPASGAVAARDWRRFVPSRRQMWWGLLGGFVLLAALLGVAYATTPIPSPNSFATAQTTYLDYSNGHQIGTIGQSTRTDVPLQQVPIAVQHAVLAAEDRHFFHEQGISPTGILRALWVDLRGGDISQGGSTITQQYVKNAYLTQQRTFTRKLKEIVISVKLGRSKSKNEILQNYLNTIYFGRGADGIEAASRAYFGRNVDKLTVAQGALLAAVIRGPSIYDPRVNRSAALSRWQYVIAGMVKEHWLTAEQAARLRFPETIKFDAASTNSGCAGPLGFVCQAAKDELARDGFDATRLAAGGYRVYTTINQEAETAAVQAEEANAGGYQKDGRESALVSVKPGDGAIQAMYGGSEFCEHKHPDDCTDLTGVDSSYARPPGSSFKPYTVIAALQQGISLNSTYDGPPHIPFPGTNGKGISNSGGESCSHCTLTRALAESVNTIFVPLAQQVGPDKVAQAAHDAGIPASVNLPDVPSITLGPTDVSPLDQAVGYATIAAQGVEASPYLIAVVRNSSGETVYKAQKKTKRVFDADVMSDVTYAMTQVLDALYGTAAGHQLSGRPAAGKTGTNGNTAGTGNLDAWFVGFTPQLSTAVWFGNHDRNVPVTSSGGGELFGADEPASTWQQMMNAALTGQPVLTFPQPADVGTAQGNSTTTPTPSSTQTPSGSATPSVTVTPSVGPPTIVPLSPTGSPSPSPSASSSPGAGVSPATAPSPGTGPSPPD